MIQTNASRLTACQSLRETARITSVLSSDDRGELQYFRKILRTSKKPKPWKISRRYRIEYATVINSRFIANVFTIPLKYIIIERYMQCTLHIYEIPVYHSRTPNKWFIITHNIYIHIYVCFTKLIWFVSFKTYFDSY